jgi:hypothetical protein
MRTPLAFAFGAIAATLVAAAAFRGGGQPVDSTFTYQGQLRNAGALVNGSVDVRFTLWDSDVGGTQIGKTNSFTNYPLTDGRFALGLNFGNDAFNGDQRWVQIEFRSPSGVGQYLTLNPRDKIMATPYALYALNGTVSQWDYNPKTQSLTAAANVSKVGIGTSAPTAALEVVSATGGDDAVKLPAGSVGLNELDGSALAASATWTGDAPGVSSHPGGPMLILERTVYLPVDGVLTLANARCDDYDLPRFMSIFVNGEHVATTQSAGFFGVNVSISLSAGVHRVQFFSEHVEPCENCGLARRATAVALFTPRTL